jgi:hypothetical protein
MVDATRVATGATAALAAAVSGAIALVGIVLFFIVGQPFGTVNDIALLVMTLSLPPVMLAHYELGGVVPLWPARLSLAGAAAAAAAWALIQLAFVAGVVAFDYETAATGWLAAQTVVLVVIGLWIGGASLLAGSWLSATTRALGIVAGAGTIAMAAGLLLGGVNHPLSYVGGVGYQVVLPIWAYALSRVFRAQAASTAGSATIPAGGTA